MSGTIPKRWLEAEVKLVFDHSYFLGGGGATAGILDNFLLRDGRNRPYIPGSTMKGRLCHNAVMIARALGEETCDQRKPRQAGCRCLICRLFGAEGYNPGGLYFDNLYPVLPEEADLPPVLRAGVAIDHARRGVQEGRLFFMETAAPLSVPFMGGIEGALVGADAGKAVALLYLALKLMRTLGGGQSRGMGWVTPSLTIKLDGQVIEPSAIEGWVTGWRSS